MWVEIQIVIDTSKMKEYSAIRPETVAEELKDIVSELIQHEFNMKYVTVNAEAVL